MIRRISFPCILFLLCLGTDHAVYSQSADAGMWNSFTIEKDISKRLSVFASQELRLKENFTQPDELFTDLGASYKPLKRVKLSFSYRFIEKYDPRTYYWQGFRFGHRLMLDLSYRYKIKRWILSYRSRWQTEMKYVYSSDKGKVPEWEWRNRFEIKYDLNRFEPYAGTELFYQFRNPRHPEGDFSLYTIKVVAGADFHIDRMNTIGVFFLVQRDRNIPNPQNLSDAGNMNVLGVEYSIVFPAVKKKKSAKK
jgi:hypothetical protein